MRLKPEDVERFYRIWFPLLHYVNQQRHLVPAFPAQWENASVDTQDAAILRDALWSDDEFLGNFITENPASLSPEDISLAQSWKNRVSGEFFIFRYLKKHTVFLNGDSPARAYGVLGIVSPIEEIVGPSLPVYVKAVLLPFEGKIIYDSLLAPYAVRFGGGYRSSLASIYRNIQEREGIITSLLPGPEEALPENIRKGISGRNKKVLRAFQKYLGQSGLSPKMMEQHSGNIDVFAQEHLLLQSPPRGLLEMTVRDVEAYLQSKKPNLVSFKRFARFLRDTMRMDYEQAEDLLDYLKRER